MKRSEILSHIESLIIDELREDHRYQAPEFTVTREHLPRLAEELLDMLEFQGMLPPSCDPESEPYTSWDEE